MNFNYRIARKKIESLYKGKISVYYEYFIVEAYCDDNGKVGLISSEPAELYSDTIAGVAQTFLRMKKAFYLPVLDYHEIPEPGYKESKESFVTALNSGDLFKKLDDGDYPTDEEIEKMEKELEIDRVSQESLFRHLIREFIYEEPKSGMKLQDFYYKKD